MDSICKKGILCIFSVSTMCNVFIEDVEPRESCQEDGNSPGTEVIKLFYTQLS